MSEEVLLRRARQRFLASLCAGVLRVDNSGVPSNADKHNKLSVRIALKMADLIGQSATAERLSGQTAGSEFEHVCCQFLRDTFLNLQALRPGKWTVHLGGSISKFQQYSHMETLGCVLRSNPEIAAVVQWDYTISPDITIARETEPDEVINKDALIVDCNTARHAYIRRTYSTIPLLHASISCKWTIRSDRSQNARTEGLNLARNRRGHQPHIVLITGEPLPSRLASVAIGTGDLDCVYHVALPELVSAVEQEDGGDACELLRILIDGKRLKDISDLPLDLAV
jgi:hypothetical protein